jgi:hypothetical protein
MKGSLRFFLALCVSAFTFALLGASVAAAGDTTSGSQLIDVSKQVGDIQKKLDQLIARGQSTRPGRPMASDVTA